jgi:hypothetical protein
MVCLVISAPVAYVRLRLKIPHFNVRDMYNQCSDWNPELHGERGDLGRLTVKPLSRDAFMTLDGWNVRNSRLGRDSRRELFKEHCRYLPYRRIFAKILSSTALQIHLILGWEPSVEHIPWLLYRFIDRYFTMKGLRTQPINQYFGEKLDLGLTNEGSEGRLQRRMRGNIATEVLGKERLDVG